MEKSREHLDAETGLAPVATLGVVAVLAVMLASSVLMMKQSPCVLVFPESLGEGMLRRKRQRQLVCSSAAPISIPITAHSLSLSSG